MTDHGIDEATLVRWKTYHLRAVDGRQGVELIQPGAEVKLDGIQHGRARVVARNAGYLVVAFGGWGENPGSRYSGLHTYYQAETVAYQVTGTEREGALTVLALITWKTRPGKTKQ